MQVIHVALQLLNIATLLTYTFGLLQTISKQEQTICATLDLIWRKLQVGQKLVFYFKLKLLFAPNQVKCV